MRKLVSIDWNPPGRTLRQFGYIALAGFTALSWAAWHEQLMFATGLGTAREPVSLVLLGIGIIAGSCSLIAPQLNRFLFVGMSLLAYPIGFVTSYVVLGVLFFAVLAPIAVAFRLLGRDPLRRNLDKRAKSYWSTPQHDRGRDSYFQQF